MVKIKTVSYTALFNLGNYNNERIGLTVTLEEGENVEAVVETLRDKVRLMALPDKPSILDAINESRVKLRDLQQRIDQKSREWNSVAEFLRQQGIKTDAVDMPIFKNLLNAAKQEVVEEGEIVDDENDVDVDDEESPF